MTRFSKIYRKYKHSNENEEQNPKKECIDIKGYAFIKRKVGLMSNEVDRPEYHSVTELSKYTDKSARKTQ